MQKFTNCTAGHSMKLAFKAGRYTSWNFRITALRPPPSVTVMNVKKHANPVPHQYNASEKLSSGLTHRGENQLVEADPL